MRTQTEAVDANRFSTWIEAGRAGEMEYLKRRDAEGVLLRSDVRVAIPWARSVIICAINYNAAPQRSIDPAPKHRLDRAIRMERPSASGDGTIGPSDYHEELLTRLRSVEKFHPRACAM